MRLVLDTGVPISAVLTPTGICRALLDEVVDRPDAVKFVVSPRLLRELEQVITRPKFLGVVSTVEAMAFVALIRSVSDLEEDPSSPTTETRDPKDDYLVALARAFADHLVSGDRDIGEANLDISVLAPRDALELVRSLR